MNNSDPHADPKQGWTPQPDGRGTLDILWSCCLTMFLCSWSILCINIPGPNEKKTHILWRKFSLTALGILCPEIVFEIAFGQWLSARKSVRDFNSIGVEDQQAKEKWYQFGWVEHISASLSRTRKNSNIRKWTLKEAFLADMGGFILSSKDHGPFPLDAQQLHYLVSKDYVERPNLDPGELEEKNKVDGLLRTITVGQILWFFINTIGRWAQNLAVTTAELTTVSFIFCSLGTTFFWWHKPADAVRGKLIVMKNNLPINEFLSRENQPLDAWKRTPLDFISRKEWWWSICWSNFVNILRHMHLTFGSEAVPNDRIADSYQKELPRKPLYTCYGLTVGYFSVLFAAWNYSFPTRIEQLLWRAACVTLMATLSALAGMTSLVGIFPKLEHTFRRLTGLQSPQTRHSEKGFRNRIATKGRRISQTLNTTFDRIRNNSVDKDPLLYAPLRLIIPIYLIAVFYCHARVYILIADILELRSLPASAYATVDWQKYWPHLG